MLSTIRRSRPATMLAVLLLVAGACTTSVGPLGTPAQPAMTPAASEPAPSDVAPITPTPEPLSPTPTPDTEPSLSPSASATPPAPSVAPTPSPVAMMVVRAYFVLGSASGNEGLVPVLREVPEAKAVARAAMIELLAGPAGVELDASPAISTAIPASTRLLGLSIDKGIATVNLSGEFESGGGSFSVMARLAQVVYTLTQFSTVDAVRFELDGTPVTLFSGEGVILDGPVGRADYRHLLPGIFVDRPAWSAAGGNPMRVSGLANVYEATLQVQVLSARGTVLADEVIMASCGTGCWGTFKVDVAYEVAKAQYGTLRVFSQSPKDGSPINVTEYRVWLTP